ncbi:MAG: hypothetical protein IJJ04_02255 [Clostridia bacterium]|nr:hypothetical protein [Clostridia bacterium]
MKFKKVFFLWLFLAVVFSCVKTDAKILKMQSRYFGFDSGNFTMRTEVFMPYLKQNEMKLELLKKDFFCHNDDINNAPDVVIVIDNGDFSENEEKFLLDYEKSLISSGMFLDVHKIGNARAEFYVKIDVLRNISKKSELSESSMLDFIVSVYMRRFKEFFGTRILNFTGNQYNFFVECLTFDGEVSAKKSTNFFIFS